MGIGAALAILNSSRARATVRPRCALRQASLGVFCLGLVAGAQPLAGQDVELKRLSPTAYACKVLTADHVSRYSSITSALRSGAVGVQLVYSSGQAGTGPRLRIRGNSSIYASLEPMVFIDGVRMTDDTPGAQAVGARAAHALDLIDPSDVLAISVLSGPAGTALYGTQAAGGVIHVYSKRGDVDAALDDPGVVARCGR